MDSADRPLSLAREHGLHLELEGSDVDVSGTDFLVAHAVDERGVRWVVRAPRRDDVMARAKVEHRALELARPRLPVQVPVWRVFSECMIAYPRLEGDPAAVVDLDAGGYVWRFETAAPPDAFLGSLAEALAALHGISADDAAKAGLPVRGPEQLRQEYAERMERSRGMLEVPDAIWRRWQAWLADETFWPRQPAPVHGDLHPGHLLLDPEHRVTGILDWTEAHVGDPATDFALLHATLGRASLDGLLERYRAHGGRVRPRLAEHVVECWAAYPVVVADFARLTGEEAHRQLAQTLVDATARETGVE